MGFEGGEEGCDRGEDEVEEDGAGVMGGVGVLRVGVGVGEVLVKCLEKFDGQVDEYCSDGE